MKKTPISALPEGTPEHIQRMASGCKLFDSSSSPEAMTVFIRKDEGFYLKISSSGSLLREWEMTKYFHSKGLGAKVLDYYSSDSKDYLLTESVRGDDCTHKKYLDDPRRLCDILSSTLRSLHETSFDGCPVKNRMESYLDLVDENYKKDLFSLDFSAMDKPFENKEAAYAFLNEGRSLLKNEVLLHGDYCLPNIILDDWNFSGFIDLGNGGVGDRHVDLFWGIWTLNFNLGTNKFRERFLDGYGRDLIDEYKIKLIATAEIFG